MIIIYFGRTEYLVDSIRKNALVILDVGRSVRQSQVQGFERKVRPLLANTSKYVLLRTHPLTALLAS
jgi:hypothetical protein